MYIMIHSEPDCVLRPDHRHRHIPTVWHSFSGGARGANRWEVQPDWWRKYLKTHNNGANVAFSCIHKHIMLLKVSCQCRFFKNRMTNNKEPPAVIQLVHI